MPRRHSADARPFVKTRVDRVSTRHVENVRHVKAQAKVKPAGKVTDYKAVGLNPVPRY